MPVLASNFRVVAIDLPGQGDSDRALDGYDTQTVAGACMISSATSGSNGTA